MRRYEMMIIIRDSVDEDGVKTQLEKVRSLITDKGGKLLDETDWGKREFAYEIEHRNHGWYSVFDFELGLDDLTELERQLKLSDDVLRFKTVRPDQRIRNTA